jgi:hypothetical protein
MPKQLGIGRCDGISVTSLRLFRAIDQRPPDAATAAELSFNDTIAVRLAGGVQASTVARNVTYFDLAQFMEPVASARKAALRDSLATIWNKLVESFRPAASGVLDPYILMICRHSPNEWWRSTISSHTIVPFALGEQSSAQTIWVYDSNTPLQSGQIIIDPRDKTWRYTMADGTQWKGHETEHSIGLVPVGEYAAPLTAPWATRRQP